MLTRKSYIVLSPVVCWALSTDAPYQWISIIVSKLYTDSISHSAAEAGSNLNFVARGGSSRSALHLRLKIQTKPKLPQRSPCSVSPRVWLDFHFQEVVRWRLMLPSLTYQAWGRQHDKLALTFQVLQVLATDFPSQATWSIVRAIPRRLFRQDNITPSKMQEITLNINHRTTVINQRSQPVNWR